MGKYISHWDNLHRVNIPFCFVISLWQIWSGYYSDVTWVSRRLESSATQLFVQQFAEANDGENTRAPLYRPFVRWGESTGVDSLHKGSLMRKAFPCHEVLMGHIYNHGQYDVYTVKPMWTIFRRDLYSVWEWNVWPEESFLAREVLDWSNHLCWLPGDRSYQDTIW